MGELGYYTVRLRISLQELDSLSRLSAQARAATGELSAEGTPVRFVRSVFVPEDGTCFHLYQAGSVDVVREAARRAHLSVEDIATESGDAHSG